MKDLVERVVSKGSNIFQHLMQTYLKNKHIYADRILRITLFRYFKGILFFNMVKYYMIGKPSMRTLSKELSFMQFEVF